MRTPSRTPRSSRGPDPHGVPPVTGQQGGTSAMADPQEYKALTREELDDLAGEALPERAAMSLINANVAIPINAAIAANVLSDNATAAAGAAQTGAINQGT